MKKTLIYLLGLFVAFPCHSKNTNYPVISNELRAPAYPLVTIDPYTSGWSMSDNLYDTSVQHWTGKDFPLLGVLKVDGKVFRFMGTENAELMTLVPTSEQRAWSGKYTETQPGKDWMKSGFDDSGWKSGDGAFGTKENEPTAVTQWGTRNIWVRRLVNISENIGNRPVYLMFSNDDDAIFYINGKKVFSTGATCNKNRIIRLSTDDVAALKKGENLIAAECVNPVGNGLLDFGLMVQKDAHTLFEQTAVQSKADVQATQTHYTFTCGAVKLELSFMAPLLLNNLDLVSRPVNYVTYKVSAQDGKRHNVELYFEASPQWALDSSGQECFSEAYEQKGLVFLKTGSKAQQILAKKGDDLRIDWGHFYLSAEKKNTIYGVGSATELRRSFVAGKKFMHLSGDNDKAKLALVRKYTNVTSLSDKIMIGYDDIYSIQYFGQNLRPYWNRSGSVSFESQFLAANKDFDVLIKKCYEFDYRLMKEAIADGGKEYASLCALAYRQAVSAHKLVIAPNGDLLFFSKENNSNGSIGTVDISYPSAPLLLLYNTELAKGTLNHIYYYSESGKWNKPFPAHDVGTYPIANGQTYGGDMPIEEGGNMVILTAAICQREGKADYAMRHWNTLQTWTDYLVQYGLDPENQLCTDDFAGHFAHNTNLSIKAIVGIGSFAKMAKMLGKEDVAAKYDAIARDYANKWIGNADDGDHFRLTFDKSGTWSQKYNLVWDEILKLNLFPKNVKNKEIAYYLTKMNRYGLPLDNRETYTKTDWIMWTATLANDLNTFRKFVVPVYNFECETIDRVPMSDWIFTDKPNYRGFKARSVVGGYFIKMLQQRMNK